MSRRTVLCLLVLCCLCALAPRKAHAEDLPPPRVIDRRTGKDIVPGPRPAPQPAQQPRRQPAPVAQPAPSARQPRVGRPKTPAPGCEPGSLQPAPTQTNARWTTPRDATQPDTSQSFAVRVPDWRPWRRVGETPGGGIREDIRKLVPFVSVHYAFAMDHSSGGVTRDSDTLDISAFYPVTDRLSIGVMGRYLATEGGVSGGPLVNFQLLQESGSLPHLSVGALWLIGDHAEEIQENGLPADQDADVRFNVNATLMKELPLPFDSGPIRALRVGTGVGYNWRQPDRFTDGWEWWVGPQVDLPANFAVYGQFFTGCACNASLAAGISWWSPWGINFTVSLFGCVGDRTGFRGGFGDFVVSKRGTGTRFSGFTGGQAGAPPATRLEMGGL